MARRGRSASPSRSPTRAAPRRAAPAPAPARQPSAVAAPPPAAVGQPISQGPGLMGQMAATAGGVAIGHTVGHMITGAFSGGSEPAQEGQQQMQPALTPAGAQSQPWNGSACKDEFARFIECTQNQVDISLCEGLNQMLRDCKVRYGPQNF